MPLISILRFLFTLFSLAVLGLAVWAGWNWYFDEAYWTADGDFHVVVFDWRLWAGIALLAWSFLGKFIWVPLLARPDTAAPSDPTPQPGQQLQSGSGASLHTESWGEGRGPVLVFVHGWAMDATMWSYARRHFSARHRVVAYDHPGLGQSRAPSTITLSGLAEDLLTVINGIGAPCVLVGHSIGGMTIQTLARNRPDLFDGRQVAGVVLVNTTYTNPLATMILSRLALALRPLLEIIFRLQIWLFPLAWLSNWQSYLSGAAHMANRIVHGPNVTRSQLEHGTLLATRNNPGVVAKGDLAMFRWDATDALSLLPVPVLVLGGESDIVTKPSASEYIAASTPTSELELMPRSNHMSVLDEAPAYHRQIDRFLDTLNATPERPPLI